MRTAGWAQGAGRISHLDDLHYALNRRIANRVPGRMQSSGLHATRLAAMMIGKLFLVLDYLPIELVR